MPDVELLPALARSVLRDLKASSTSGAPPLGHLIGLHRQDHGEGDEGYVLALDPARPAMTGGAGILEVSMLADLALGGVIRNRVGLAVQMPTISMTIQLTPGRVAEVTSADGDVSGLSERTASARSRLRTATGEVVGGALGVFALPRLPYQGLARAMPWDVVSDEGVPGDDAADAPADQSLVDEVHAHATGSPARAWGTTHVRRRLVSSDEDTALAPSTAMANRFGHVQGGALFSSAVMAAAERGGFEPETFASGTIGFLEPADLQTPVLVRVSVGKAGGRSLFADVRLEQEGRSCCHVSMVFRR